MDFEDERFVQLRVVPIFTYARPRFVWLLLAASGAAPSLAPGAEGEAKPASGTSTFGIGVEFYGRTPYPIPSRGVRLGYFLDDGSAVQLTYVKSEKTLLLSNFKYSEYGLRRVDTFGSVLHWGFGLGVREVELAYDVFVAEEPDDRHVHERHQAITGTAFFGLEIPLLDSVVLGTDMFGVSVPLHWTRTDDFPATANDAEENPEDFPYIRDGLRTNFHLLRSYVEVRF